MDTKTRPDPVARARELGAEIATAADEIERTQRIPEALLRRLQDSRLFRLLLPRSAVGEETTPAVYVAAVEELARHDASIGWIAFVTNSSALISAYLEPAVVSAIFADPRSTIAWGPPNASRAQAADGGYRLTGRWDFASGCRQANWMGAHCHVLEADGALRLNRFGRPTVRTLLFPAHGATLLDTWRTIGLRGTASDSYRVDELFVSEAFSSTREDPSLRRERGARRAFRTGWADPARRAARDVSLAHGALRPTPLVNSAAGDRPLRSRIENSFIESGIGRARTCGMIPLRIVFARWPLAAATTTTI